MSTRKPMRTRMAVVVWMAALVVPGALRADSARVRINGARVIAVDSDQRAFTVRRRGSTTRIEVSEDARIVRQVHVTLDEIKDGMPINVVGDVSADEHVIEARDVVIPRTERNQTRIARNQVMGEAGKQDGKLAVKAEGQRFRCRLGPETNYIRTVDGGMNDVRSGLRVNVTGRQGSDHLKASYVFLFAPERARRADIGKAARGVKVVRGPERKRAFRRRVIVPYIAWHPLSENQKKYPDIKLQLPGGDPVEDMRREVDMARRHGIDGWEFELAIRNYLGHINSYEQMLQAAEGRDFTVYPEIWSTNFFRSRTSRETPGVVVPVYRAWMRRYAEDNRVPRIDGKPVMLYYAANYIRPATWANLFRGFAADGMDAFHVGELHEWEWVATDNPITDAEVIPYMNEFDGYWLFGASTPLHRGLRINRRIGEILHENYGNTKLFSPGVCWGYWNANTRTNYIADNTRPFRERWEQCLKLDADWIMITTWNEHNESTMIQPTLNRSYTLLKLTEYYAKRWKQQPAILEEGNWNVSYRKEILVGEEAEFEFITLPDGQQRNFYVGCDLYDAAGNQLHSFQPRRHTGETIEVATFRFDTSSLAMERAVIPRFHIRAGSGPDAPYILKPMQTVLMSVRKDKVTDPLCWHVTLDKVAAVKTFRATLNGEPFAGEHVANEPPAFALKCEANQPFERVFLYKNHRVARIFGGETERADVEGWKRRTIRIHMDAPKMRWFVGTATIENGKIIESETATKQPGISDSAGGDTTTTLHLRDTRTRSHRDIVFEALVRQDTEITLRVGKPAEGVRQLRILGELQRDAVVDATSDYAIDYQHRLRFNPLQVVSTGKKLEFADGVKVGVQVDEPTSFQHPPRIDARTFEAQSGIPVTDRDWDCDLYYLLAVMDDGSVFYSPPAWVQGPGKAARVSQAVYAEAQHKQKRVFIPGGQVGHAEWRFDESNTALRARDYGPFRTHLRMALHEPQTRPEYTTVDGRSCLSFDGEDDYLNIPLGVTPTGAFTLDGWLKIRRPRSAHLFGRGHLRVTIDGVGRIHVQRRLFGPVKKQSRLCRLTSESRLEPGDFHHVALVCDQEALRLYIDGALERETPCQGFNMHSPAGFVGGLPNGKKAFSGWLDDWRLHYRPLSPEAFPE